MAEIGVRIIGEDQASDAFRAVSEASRSTASEINGLGGTFSSLSNVIASGVVKGQAIIGLFTAAVGAARNAANAIGGFIDQTVSMSASLEGSRQAFSVLLGSSEKATALLNQMLEASRTTTMSFEEFRSSARYMLGFGFEAEKVVSNIKDIGAAVYALGAQNQGGMERIVRALGQMQAQGRVSREELNQLAEVGVPALQMLANHFGTTTAEMSQMVRKGTVPVSEAINGLIGQFREMYGAGAAQMSQSFEVMTSNLSDYVQQAQIAIGSGIFETNRERLREITKILASPVFMEIAQKLGTTLGDAYRKFNDTAVTPAIRAVAEFMNMLDTTNPRPAVTQLLDNLSGIMNGLINQYFGGAGIGVVKNFMAVLNQLSSGVISLLQGGNIFDAIRQISSIGQDTNAGQFVGALAREFEQLIIAGRNLKEFVVPLFNDLMDAIGDASNNPAVKDFQRAFLELFSVTDKNGQTFRLQFGEIVGFIRVSVQNIVEFITPVAPVLRDLFNAITPALETALNIMTRTIELVNSIKNLFAEVKSGSVAPAREASQAIAGNFSAGLSDALSQSMSSLASDVLSRFGAIAASLSSSTAASGEWQNLGSSIVQSVINGFEGGFNGLVNRIQSTLGTVNIPVNIQGYVTGGTNSPGATMGGDMGTNGNNGNNGNNNRGYGAFGDLNGGNRQNNNPNDQKTIIINNNMTINAENIKPEDLQALANFMYLKFELGFKK